jgi:hypothetical protein
VLALLIVELITVVALLAVGVSITDISKGATPVIAVTLAFLSPTMQELGRRQPAFAITADQAGFDHVVHPIGPTPWPIDCSRIIANEIDDARQLALTRSNSKFLDTLALVNDPFAIKPSQADHTRAREEFDRELHDFESSLHEWLVNYASAATARSRTFKLSLRIENKGAYAEATTLVLDLPSTVEVVADDLVVDVPPERPQYKRPLPYRRSTARESGWVVDRPVRPYLVEGLGPPNVTAPLSKPRWKASTDGRQLETPIGELHQSRSLHAGDLLILRASRYGVHEIKWTVYSKSAPRPTRGTIRLNVAPTPDRPAFGRLHGVVSYSDVPLVDEDGNVVHPARTSDPPLTRPKYSDEDGDAISMLEQASAGWEWDALGLDPASDGTSDRVKVSRAVRRTSAENTAGPS